MMKLMDELIANYREQINQKDEEIEALRAENARLQREVLVLEMFKGMVRDFDAKLGSVLDENARLTKERDNALHRAAEYRDKCNQLWNDNNLLRAGRKEMGESDEN